MSNENNFTLKIEKVNQAIGSFCLTKIDAHTLYKMSESDIISISKNAEDYEGIQRSINNEKVKSIKNYLTSFDATFPNNIILNIEQKNIISNDNNTLVIRNVSDTFKVIDGQHRLAGFSDKETFNKFELPVAIFIDLSDYQQSRIFVTINSEQTKVDPSLSFYQQSKDEYYTPRKMLGRIAIALSKNDGSPWKNKIKLIGKKDALSEDGIISLSTFTRKLLEYIYRDNTEFNKVRNILADASNAFVREKLKDNKDKEIQQILEKSKYIKEELKDNKDKEIQHILQESQEIPIKNFLENIEIKTSFLWNLYLNEKEGLLYKILLNYFTAVKNVLPNDWDDSKSILTKSTGYNALILLFRDLYEEASETGNYTEDFFYKKLSNLSSLDTKINTSNYSGSSEKSSKDLYIQFKDKLS